MSDISRWRKALLNMCNHKDCHSLSPAQDYGIYMLIDVKVTCSNAVRTNMRMKNLLHLTPIGCHCGSSLVCCAS